MKYWLFIFLLGIHAVMAAPKKEVAVETKEEPEVSSTEDSPFEEIEAALGDKYFTKKPTQFMIDPQGFISSQHRKNVDKILNNHAADSAIDLYVCIFGQNQKLPLEGKHNDFVNRHFSQGKPVVIIYYYYDNPNRTEMILSPSLSKVVSSSEQQRSIQSSLMRAMRVNGSFEQLEEFLIQFSVRTYWMERMLEESKGGTEVATVIEQPLEPSPVAKKSKNPLEMIPEEFREPAIKVGIGLGSFVILCGLIYWIRSRARHKFPEFEVEARLGGSHAAGIGAVVNFASPAVSPARQREQVPEYLRRA
jgi:hypothetical protein